MSFQGSMTFRSLVHWSLRQSTNFRNYPRNSLFYSPKTRSPEVTFPRYGRGIHTTRIARDRSFTNLLADDNPPPVQVDSISDSGIQLADGLVLPGACIFLEGKVFLWDVPSTDLKSKLSAERWKGWGGELFQILEVVTPRPEMLLLGTGKTLVQPPPFLRSYLTGLGIQLDVMDTRNACSTYNLLSEEGRRVAAALLPVSSYSWPKPKSSVLPP